MKKLCFVTAARSEYGLLKWLMQDVKNSEAFALQLIVTGGHLLTEQGHTIDQILEDGFQPDAVIDVQLDTASEEEIAASMGRFGEKSAHVLEKLKPDYLVVLGDRYELLPVCSTAFVMQIPIIHIGGGDVTQGAIDDGIRNAVTMLAAYHFPGTKASAENIIRMRGSDQNVWAVGEPGLDSFLREPVMTRMELQENLGLNASDEWILMTYHPETLKSLEYNLSAVKYCISALEKLKRCQVLATYANADYGGKQINEILEAEQQKNPELFHVIPSLGHFRYLSFMKQASFVIGNSSSGILEAPFLKIPVVNIGDRQKGRYQCGNIIQCSTDPVAISQAVHKAMNQKVDASDSDYWGDGNASARIERILEKVL